MLIAMDHGNKLCKTANHTFISGLVESSARPPFGDEILQYNGKYYTLSDKRLPYARDKSLNDSFFILTLFGIAKEIETRECYTDEDILDIQLLIGLPPAHYGAQYEKFEGYFTKGRDVLDFTFKNKYFSIYINEVISFPQAYAAAMPVFNKIRNFAKATIVDIGGFTLDYLQIKNGQADLSACDSLDNGVIVLYNQIKSKANSDYDLLIDESDIDAIIRGENCDFDRKIIQLVEQQTKDFVNRLIDTLRERMIDLKSSKAIFVGGGSILLRQYIEASEKVGHIFFVDEIGANAKGYELLYKASKARG